MVFINSLNIISVFIIIAVLSAFFRKTVDQTLDEVQLIANSDPLTGLFNRRTMYEKLAKDIRIADQTSEPFSILIADIDNFKTFNDDHGHDCGDLVLTQCADLLREFAGTNGAVSRWGGEEFLILLHSADTDESSLFAERVRKKINDQVFLYHELQFKISITIGVATYRQQEKIAEVIKRADQALLSGKRKGKNRVMTTAL
jgi:diguanylate cyclase (GGDEF)-like protein